jgi:dienelactone hydrolase
VSSVLDSDGVIEIGGNDASPCAQALYLGAEPERIFAWYHPPTVPATRDCAVVLCSPLGNEATGWHRACRHWARTLAAAGIATIRFDYPGMGDSSGEADERHTVRSWIASIGAAADAVRARSGCRHVALIGAQLGATLALAAAIDRGDIDGLILWAAQPTGRSYLREGRAFTRLMGLDLEGARRVLPAGAEQIGGLVLHADMIADLQALDPLAGGRDLSARVLIIPRDAQSNDSALTEALTAAGATVERKVADGYARVMADAHQAEVPDRVFAATIEWLVAQYPVGEAGPRHAPPPMADDSVLVIPRPVDADRAAAHLADAVVEQPLFFGEGKLFGVLSRPSNGPKRRTGVLLVNSGSVYRVAPNRLYVTLARRWASLGYTVVRMDIGGVGDSPTPAGADENHPYPAHAVPDIAFGLAALRARGVERVVVGGLCSGAHASFHAGIELHGIDGLLVVNPIVFYWQPSDPLDIDAWRTYFDARRLKKSARRWASWMRLFRGEVNIPYALRVGIDRTGEVARAKLAGVRRLVRGDRADSKNAPRDFRRIAAAGTDVLLLFSVGDPGLDALQLNFPRELRDLERVPGFRLRILEDADHTFTSIDARRRAVAVLTEHLLARHP